MTHRYDHDRFAACIQLLARAHDRRNPAALVGLYEGSDDYTLTAIVLSTATARLRHCLASDIDTGPLLTAIAFDLAGDPNAYDVSAQGLIGVASAMCLAAPGEEDRPPALREIATPPDAVQEGEIEVWRHIAAIIDDGTAHEQFYNPTTGLGTAAVMAPGNPGANRPTFHGLAQLLAAIRGEDLLSAPIHSENY